MHLHVRKSTAIKPVQLNSASYVPDDPRGRIKWERKSSKLSTWRLQGETGGILWNKCPIDPRNPLDSASGRNPRLRNQIKVVKVVRVVTRSGRRLIYDPNKIVVFNHNKVSVKNLLCSSLNFNRTKATHWSEICTQVIGERVLCYFSLCFQFVCISTVFWIFVYLDS